MSRPAPISSAPAADARATLAEPDTAAFDRLAHALLAAPSAPSRLTSDQWLSRFGCWMSASRAPSAGGTAGRAKGGRPSTHGHAPGATAIPRWGR